MMKWVRRNSDSVASEKALRPSEAAQSLRKVMELDKESKEARTLLVKLRQFVKAEVAQEKSKISRMMVGATSAPAGTESNASTSENGRASIAAQTKAAAVDDTEVRLLRKKGQHNRAEKLLQSRRRSRDSCSVQDTPRSSSLSRQSRESSRSSKLTSSSPHQRLSSSSGLTLASNTSHQSSHGVGHDVREDWDEYYALIRELAGSMEVTSEDGSLASSDKSAGATLANTTSI